MIRLARVWLLPLMAAGCLTQPVPEPALPVGELINSRETGFEVYVPADRLLAYANEAMVGQGLEISERTPTGVSGTLPGGWSVVVSTEMDGSKNTVKVSAQALGRGDSASPRLEALISDIVEDIHRQIQGR